MSKQLTEQKAAPVVDALSHSRLILVICRTQELPRLKREFEAWQEAGYHLLASGTTSKRFDGFLLCAWREKPVPRSFLDKLMQDLAIFDYAPVNLLATGV